MELASNIFYLLANIVLLIGAIIGIAAISTVREKKLMTCFNFFSMLRIRLKHILLIYKEYDFEIKEAFFPQKDRGYRDSITSTDASFIIFKFSQSAEDCIKFLMTANDQLSPSDNWKNQISTLLEFLTDLSFLTESKHCKWTYTKDNKEESEKYFSNHINNLQEILDVIEQQLLIYEKVLNKEKVINK